MLQVPRFCYRRCDLRRCFFSESGDVASIEILKDASSTAIYGSRGANGVIMITTRQGTNDGKTRVELYANLGMQQAVRQFDMLNSSEYALMRYKTGWKYYPYGTDPSTMSDGIVYRDNPNGDGNYWVLPESSTYADWESFGAPVVRILNGRT